jgi:hypothetical protein
MKVDIQYIPEHQKHIHDELINWAMTVADGRENKVSPMFRQYRSHAWQWHEPEFRPTVRPLDGWKMNANVVKLPEKHRKTLVWFYIQRTPVYKARKQLGLTEEGLNKHVVDARQMLINIS